MISPPQSTQSQMRQELSKFINLLQTDFNSSQNLSTQHKSFNQYSLSKKLSIILSASQPQSSSLDKQNSNPSANRSFQSNQKEKFNIQEVLKTLLNTKLSLNQIKLIDYIKEYIDQSKRQNNQLQNQIKILKKQLISQKNTNDEMVSVLMKLDMQEKQLWNNYNDLNKDFKNINEKNNILVQNLEKMKQTINKLQNDNDFMKKLIFHANQNYQALERKCQEMEKDKVKVIVTDRKRNGSSDNLLKSARTKKNSHSPTYSQLNSSPKSSNFQDIYRKMIVRTLKCKGKSKNGF